MKQEKRCGINRPGDRQGGKGFVHCRGETVGHFWRSPEGLVKVPDRVESPTSQVLTKQLVRLGVESMRDKDPNCTLMSATLWPIRDWPASSETSFLRMTDARVGVGVVHIMIICSLGLQLVQIFTIFGMT